MAKLFVAADLPPEVLRSIEAALPSPGSGVRVISIDELHLTVHYLGEADLEKVRTALQSITAEPLPLVIKGVGQFDGAKGSTVVWAGVEPSEALNQLHEAIGQALAPIGFTPEKRAYFPHVTLARCDASTSPDLVASIIVAASSQYAAGRIESFTLYSSAFVDGVPRYNAEATFPLDGHGTDGR
jgi:RNA 2',3'-cyclic 3'-phosphodiesterase